MSDPTLDFDVLSMLAKNPDAIAASAPVSFAPPGPSHAKHDDSGVIVGQQQQQQSLDDSALAVIDQWTEKTEKEEAMDQLFALNSSITSPQQEANSETVTDFDSAMDAVEKWTQEEEEVANEEDDSNTPTPRSEEGSELSVPTVATVITLATVDHEPEKQAQEIERLRTALIQAQQEIEALETSTNLYRMQLKQAKEMQRVRSLEVEQVKSTNDQALEQALQVQAQLQTALSAAQENIIQLKAMVEAKDQELIKLKLDNHEYPSKILKLQTELESERAKFKNLVDRFNSVKELELHRQKQKFLTVSAQQKEVFDRLHAKYSETVQIAKSHAEQIALLQQQLAAKDKEIGKVHALFNQARQEIANDRAKFLQLKATYDNLKSEFDKECASKQAAITEIEQKLQSTVSEVRYMKEREQEQQKMQCYFDCAHNNEPEIGDDIRVVTQDCGDVLSYQWFRATSVGSVYQLIEDQNRDVYTATADDLGRVLKMTLTNSAGLSVSAEIGPIALPASMAPKIHEYLLFKKEIEFAVKGSTSASKNGRAILLTKDKAKLREGRSTIVKEPYGPNVSVSLDSADDTKFLLKIGASPVQHELFAESASARNMIALVVRGINFIVTTKQTYKEKEANVGFLQYLLSVMSQKTAETNFVAHKSRLSQMGSFSQKFPSHQGRSNLTEHQSISRHTSADYRNPQDAPSSSRSMSLKPTNEEEHIEYDADGYIIRKDVDDKVGGGVNDTNEIADEDQAGPSIPPIVIKPKNEAVESTPEELSRAALKFEKPPTASTSKPKPTISEDKPKKKKKKEKSDEPTREVSTSSSSPMKDINTK